MRLRRRRRRWACCDRARSSLCLTNTTPTASRLFTTRWSPEASGIDSTWVAAPINGLLSHFAIPYPNTCSSPLTLANTWSRRFAVVPGDPFQQLPKICVRVRLLFSSFAMSLPWRLVSAARVSETRERTRRNSNPCVTDRSPFGRSTWILIRSCSPVRMNVNSSWSCTWPRCWGSQG